MGCWVLTALVQVDPIAVVRRLHLCHVPLHATSRQPRLVSFSHAGVLGEPAADDLDLDILDEEPMDRVQVRVCMCVRMCSY